MHDLLLALGQGAHPLLTAMVEVPNPGGGTPPPGSEKLLIILSWVAWTVCLLCVGGFLAVGARMAILHNRGDGGAHLAGLGWVMAACFLVGSASGLVGALV